MRFLLFFLLFFSSLFGRENPFQPVSQYKEGEIKATNIVRQHEPFEEKEFSLPNSARVLKHIKVGYQALDGSIKEKKVAIDKSIDWHDPLILTKKSSLLVAPSVLEESLKTVPVPLPQTSPKQAQNKEKEPLHVKQDKKANKEIKQTKIEQIKTTKTEEKKAPLPKQDTLPKSFSFQNFLDFSVQKNQLIINSKNPLIRDFIVVNPYKIVLDFKKQNSFYTKTINIQKAPFKSVTFGSHDKFYRASFLLDGPYRYVIHKKGDTTTINLH